MKNKKIERRKSNNPTGKGGFGDRPQDINRNGAPVRGESFAEAVKRLADKTNEELADYFGRNTPIGRQFLLQPKNITSRDLLIGRALITLENDFDPRGFEKLADRAEGKPTQAIKGDPENPLKIIIEYANDTDGN